MRPGRGPRRSASPRRRGREPSALALLPDDRPARCPADFSPSTRLVRARRLRAQYCASLSPPVVPLPIWWRNACVELRHPAGRQQQVPYDVAVAVVRHGVREVDGRVPVPRAAATPEHRRERPRAGRSATRCSTTSSTDQGNQHVIVFRDDGWPHPSDLNNTLGPDHHHVRSRHRRDLRRRHGDQRDGAAHRGRARCPRRRSTSRASSRTRAGHFFGMAHSDDVQATMYAHYTQGSTYMRNLAARRHRGHLLDLSAGRRRARSTRAWPSGRHDPGGRLRSDAAPRLPERVHGNVRRRRRQQGQRLLDRCACACACALARRPRESAASRADHRLRRRRPRGGDEPLAAAHATGAPPVSSLLVVAGEASGDRAAAAVVGRLPGRAGLRPRRRGTSGARHGAPRRPARVDGARRR